jgi:hypothetical protein
MMRSNVMPSWRISPMDWLQNPDCLIFRCPKIDERPQILTLFAFSGQHTCRLMHT